MASQWTVGRRDARRRISDMLRGYPKEGRYFYAVRNGRVKGIYADWEPCKAQVHKYPDNCHKKFNDYETAHSFMEGYDEQLAPQYCAVYSAQYHGVFPFWLITAAELEGYFGVDCKVFEQRSDAELWATVQAPPDSAHAQPVPRYIQPPDPPGTVKVLIRDSVPLDDEKAKSGRFVSLYYGSKSKLNVMELIRKKGKSQIGAILVGAAIAADAAEEQGFTNVIIYAVKHSAVKRLVNELKSAVEPPVKSPYAAHLRDLWDYRHMEWRFSRMDNPEALPF